MLSGVTTIKRRANAMQLSPSTANGTVSNTLQTHQHLTDNKLLMYDKEHFTRDVSTVRFDSEVDGITVDEDGSYEIDWDDVQTVTVDNPPHANAFDTKRFHKLPTTVAKPIPQPYQYGEDTVWLKKPRDALKDAAWSLDNAPWTLGHPETGMVKRTDDVHGFWSDPRYIDSTDDLDATLMVPTVDDEAKQYIEDNSDVSVGFYNRIARTDEYDGVVGGSDTEDITIEGYQTDMMFDHVASVGVGRCPSSKGCGLAADAADSHQRHGHTEPVQYTGTTDATYSTGDWVEWDASGGNTYGKVDEVIQDGCTTRGKGDQEVCAEEDDPAVVVEVYDDETGESKDEMVRHKMSELRDWSRPTSDSADSGDTTSLMSEESGDGSGIDLVPPEAAQENAQMALDAREETDNPKDCGTETGWTRAEQLSSGEELTADVVSKMSQFARHQSNSEMGEEGKADCGWMMWKAWGGDEGVDWAQRKMDEMQDAGMTSVISEEQMTAPQFSEGQMVQWQVRNDLFGEIVAVDDEADVVMVEVMEMVDAELRSTGFVISAGYSDVMKTTREELLGKLSDALKNTVGITDENEDTHGIMELQTDQPEGVYEVDSKWFAVGPDEHPDESTDWAGDAKYPLNSCNDVRDAWNLRGTGDISIEVDTLESRIKRVADAMDCPPEFRPWDGGSAEGDAAVAASAKQYSVCGSRKDVMADREGCGCEADDDDNTTDFDMKIDFDDLSTEAALAKVEAQNDGVSDRLDELRDAEEVAEVARDSAEELGLDDVESLSDSVAMLKETKESLAETVDELQRPKMEDDAKFIAEQTDRFGETADEVIENLDSEPEAVSEKRELVEELKKGYDEQTANSGDEEATDGLELDSSGKYVKTPWN